MANISKVAIASVQTQDKNINQLQSNITSSINKFQVGVQTAVSGIQSSVSGIQSSVLSNAALIATLQQIALLQGKIISNLGLGSSGVNTITHGLGRTLTGWFIVRQRQPAEIYDGQDTNPSPQTTLLLFSSPASVGTNVFVDIYVF